MSQMSLLVLSSNRLQHVSRSSWQTLQRYNTVTHSQFGEAKYCISLIDERAAEMQFN